MAHHDMAWDPFQYPIDPDKKSHRKIPWSLEAVIQYNSISLLFQQLYRSFWQEINLTNMVTISNSTMYYTD